MRNPTWYGTLPAEMTDEQLTSEIARGQAIVAGAYSDATKQYAQNVVLDLQDEAAVRRQRMINRIIMIGGGVIGVGLLARFLFKRYKKGK